MTFDRDKLADAVQSFLAFREECAWLNQCFYTYKALYESGQREQDILDKSAACFFRDMNRVLIENLFLQICKITDPATSMGRENLTFENINVTLESARILTPEERIEINQYSGKLRNFRNRVKDARNKRVSHLDKQTLLDGLILGEHSKEESEAFFDDLQNYLDAVGIAIGLGPLDISPSGCSGDVFDLFKTLERGLELNSR